MELAWVTSEVYMSSYLSLYICVCVCVCVCIYIYIYVYICICMYVCIFRSGSSASQIYFFLTRRVDRGSCIDYKVVPGDSVVTIYTLRFVYSD